jgi:sulfur carrier protein
MIDPGARVTVTVNGSPRSLEPELTVAGLVSVVAASPRGVAVAVNAEVVPRSAWASTTLAEGDRVELLTAAQGG